MPVYVACAINLPTIAGMYDYHLPAELEGQVLPGCLVMVPFGRQTVQAIVWRFVGTPEVAQTKAVLALLDAQPVLTSAQLALAEWLARETMAPLAACFDLMLPPGMSKEADRLYTLRLDALPTEGLTESQERLASMLRERGALRGSAGQQQPAARRRRRGRNDREAAAARRRRLEARTPRAAAAPIIAPRTLPRGHSLAEEVHAQRGCQQRVAAAVLAGAGAAEAADEQRDCSAEHEN